MPSGKQGSTLNNPLPVNPIDDLFLVSCGALLHNVRKAFYDGTIKPPTIFLGHVWIFDSANGLSSESPSVL